MLIENNCELCGVIFKRPKLQRFCSHKCRTKDQYLKKTDTKISDFPSECEMCHREIPFLQRKSNRRYCSSGCRTAMEGLKYRHLNPLSLNSSHMGAIAELLVAADLLNKGYEVFRALSSGCSCDIAVLKSGKLLRIEVKTRRRTSSGNVSTAPTTHQVGKHDVMAIYVPGEPEIIYTGLPDL